MGGGAVAGCMGRAIAGCMGRGMAGCRAVYIWVPGCIYMGTRYND